MNQAELLLSSSLVERSEIPMNIGTSHFTKAKYIIYVTSCITTIIFVASHTCAAVILLSNVEVSAYCSTPMNIGGTTLTQNLSAGGG